MGKTDFDNTSSCCIDGEMLFVDVHLCFKGLKKKKSSVRALRMQKSFFFPTWTLKQNNFVSSVSNYVAEWEENSDIKWMKTYPLC